MRTNRILSTAAAVLAMIRDTGPGTLRRIIMRDDCGRILRRDLRAVSRV